VAELAHLERLWGVYCWALLRPRPARERMPWGLIDAVRRDADAIRERLVVITAAIRALAQDEYTLPGFRLVMPSREGRA
jgi:hypothetical protein